MMGKAYLDHSRKVLRDFLFWRNDNFKDFITDGTNSGTWWLPKLTWGFHRWLSVRSECGLYYRSRADLHQSDLSADNEPSVHVSWVTGTQSQQNNNSPRCISWREWKKRLSIRRCKKEKWAAKCNIQNSSKVRRTHSGLRCRVQVNIVGKINRHRQG